jgi:hypothetical protein
MQMKHNCNGRTIATLGAAIKSMTSTRAVTGLALLGLMLFALATPAVAQQTVNVQAFSPSRVTVPLNYSGTNLVGINIQIANGTNEVDVTIAGVPVGATATLNKTAFTNTGGATLTLALTNVAEACIG